MNVRQKHVLLLATVLSLSAMSSPAMQEESSAIDAGVCAALGCGGGKRVCAIVEVNIPLPTGGWIGGLPCFEAEEY